MGKKVVILDDDERILRLLSRYLVKDGFQVVTFGTVADLANRWEDEAPDAMVLDLVLPDGNGLDLAREIRSRSQIPIIMLTGKDDVVDRVVGLEVGADDYVTKPFDERELLARLNSVLRRSGKADAAVKVSTAENRGNGKLTFNGWTLDRDAIELVGPEGETIELTGYEFRLLELLVTRAQRILSRDQILENLADRSWNPYDRSIDVMIGKLRKKLEDDPKHPRLIKTIRGLGYKFTGNVNRV